MHSNNEKEAFQALCDAVHVDKDLADMLQSTNPKRFEELMRATKMLIKYKVDLASLGDVASDWRETDWRGRQGSYPTPLQLVEHCLVWRKRKTEQRRPLEAPDRIAWWKKEGLTVEQVDQMIWDLETARDPTFGKLSTHVPF